MSIELERTTILCYFMCSETHVVILRMSDEFEVLSKNHIRKQLINKSLFLKAHSFCITDLLTSFNFASSVSIRIIILSLLIKSSCTHSVNEDF